MPVDRKKSLTLILLDTYDVGPLYASTPTVLWAAKKLPSKEDAVAQIKEINELRQKWGRPLVYYSEGDLADVGKAA